MADFQVPERVPDWYLYYDSEEENHRKSSMTLIRLNKMNYLIASDQPVYIDDELK